MVKQRRVNMPPDFELALRDERRLDRVLADEFIAAVRQSDLDAFEYAVDRLNDESVSGWTFAFRSLARQPPQVTAKMRRAFCRAWTESKSIRLRVGEDLTTITVLRALMPPYSGPSLRLFRGATALSRRHRRYGLSWTDSIDVADRFARKKQTLPGGGIVLETLAQPSAIICAIEYPKPVTIEEIRRTFPNSPNLHIEQYHEEDEYLLDRRALTNITVIRRYSLDGAP